MPYVHMKLLIINFLQGMLDDRLHFPLNMLFAIKKCWSTLIKDQVIHIIINKICKKYTCIIWSFKNFDLIKCLPNSLRMLHSLNKKFQVVTWQLQLEMWEEAPSLPEDTIAPSEQGKVLSRRLQPERTASVVIEWIKI